LYVASMFDVSNGGRPHSSVYTMHPMDQMSTGNECPALRSKISGAM
jgi:hypothetical protein